MNNTHTHTHTHTRKEIYVTSKYIRKLREFPGGPAVRTLHFHCRGHVFDPWLGK